MKRFTIIISAITLLSCGGSTKKEVLQEEKKIYQININQLVGFLGKPFSSVSDNFYDVKTSTSLGDVTAETKGKKEGAPISYYNIEIVEKNGKISEIVLSTSMNGNRLNRDNLKYWDDEIKLNINSRIPIDENGSPKVFWQGTKNDFYNYLRDNPDYGGWLRYNNVEVLTGGKSNDIFGIIIK